MRPVLSLVAALGATMLPLGLTAQPPVAVGGAATTSITNPLLGSFEWRSLGPDRGGRSIAASGVRGRPAEAYFGATGGGLWKTTDGGESWKPITDGQIHSSSVGAVAVSESNPDIVFIGMGESCIRGDIMPGDGVYRSSDAGKTWTHVGFRESDAISAIRIHPTDPDIIFVASFGKYGVPSEERGVFRSTDGGRSWKRVLYRNPSSGAVDISIDPTNPDVIYAALWEAYRTEYRMSSGGAGSGLFRSTDGGESWKEITRNPGMPAGVVGKIGVAVSPVNPDRVYALVENENGGLFRSDDAGATWELVNSDRNIRQRAFYFTHVIADTKDAERVYLLNVSAYTSPDGGRTLESVGRGTHSDFHDLWIDPDDASHMVIANDGGGAVTTAAGAAWTGQEFPTAQFYHVVATTHEPYHVCGSQQDANELCVPTNMGRGGGGRGSVAPAIYSPGGSENGYIAPDPLDPDVFYSGTNANGGGFLTRLNRRTGQSREVSPYPRMFSGEPSAELVERWQWTYPVVFSPVDPKVLYVSSQHVWRTTDGGQSWDRISPDLTRHDPSTMGVSGGPVTRDMNGPEVYATVFALAPSRREVNVLWAGSDDGLIHVTRDGGANWANVTPADMPDFGRVSLIEASPHDDATAYVAVKRPLLGDRAPYLFRTHDFGQSWTRIVDGLPDEDYVHAVREDPVRRGMLYAGTQHGVYLSYDDGDSWVPLSLNLPDLPVVSMEVRGNSIAIATHGRGFYILDDIEPLRHAGQAELSSGAPILFAPAPAVRPTVPATIQYWLPKSVDRLTVEVVDQQGRVVRTFVSDSAARAAAAAAAARQGQGGGGGGRSGGGPPAPPEVSAGVHSVSWDLRYPGPTTFPGMILWGASTAGPMAPTGSYTVRLVADGATSTQALDVRLNSRFEGVTDADLAEQFSLALKLRDEVSRANDAVIRIRALKAQVAERLDSTGDRRVAAAGKKLTDALSAVEQDIYQVKNQSGQDPLNFPIRINNRLASLYSVVSRGEGRPIASAYPIFEELKKELEVELKRLDDVLSRDLPALNRELERAKLPQVGEPIA